MKLAATTLQVLATCLMGLMAGFFFAFSVDVAPAMRELDAQGVHLIWVEAPPPGPEWDGVRDRLSRAAAS